MRTLAVKVLFFCGHWTYLLCDIVAQDFPHEVWLIDRLYSLYSRLMWLSAELDKDERLWLTRRENETGEAFEARVKARYPENNLDECE